MPAKNVQPDWSKTLLAVVAKNVQPDWSKTLLAMAAKNS